MYLRTDVSPYMHVFAQHVPQFMQYLKQKEMVLRHFSTSSIEKKNYQQVILLNILNVQFCNILFSIIQLTYNFYALILGAIIFWRNNNGWRKIKKTRNS